MVYLTVGYDEYVVASFSMVFSRLKLCPAITSIYKRRHTS